MSAAAALLAALLSAVAFLWATPFLWTLVASFRPESAGSADMASLLPDLHPTLENFRNALESGTFGLYYVNTIIVVAGVLAVQCVTVSLAGYAFARLRFPGRDVPVLRLPAAAHAGAAGADRAQPAHRGRSRPLRHACPA